MPTLNFTPQPNVDASSSIGQKLILPASVYYRLLPELQATAFTISGVENMEVIQRVRDAIAAVPLGGDWRKTKKLIVAELEPWLGEEEAVTRAELLIRTHTFQAYAMGVYADGMDTIEFLPYWKYVTVGDDHVRDAHAALDGMIIRKDDPFWHTHFPPWDWGCRCQVADAGDFDAEEQQKLDAELPPEERTFFGKPSPGLDALRQGRILRAGRTIDVRAPRDKGPGHGGMIYDWHPARTRPDLQQLAARYEPEVMKDFLEWAQTIRLDNGQTLYQWMTNEPSAMAKPPTGYASLDDALGDLRRFGLKAENPITPGEAQQIIDALKKPNAAQLKTVLASMTTASPEVDRSLRQALTGFLRFLRPEVAKVLPKLRVIEDHTIQKPAEYDERSFTMRVNPTVADDLEGSVMHEAMHWRFFHGPPELKSEMAKLYTERTAGLGAPVPLPKYPGYNGYPGLFWDDYASVSKKGRPAGFEIPTRAMELLTNPVMFAGAWNKYSDVLQRVFKHLF